ncbi:MAG: zinc ribbon domain-containing protein [Candidatus Pacebacteria bacterium]|nr:zinc ribbon domain-containing protein [Candidatus Paceibacterota bacterium]
MFTAQWATGKCGGRYRYYRCTKKKGNCGQGYLREENLVAQIKERLQKISLCDRYTDYLLEKIKQIGQEENQLSQSDVKNLSDRIKASEFRLEKLIETYLDGDIPKEIYLKKKDGLMREILALKEEKKDFKHQGNNWNEPLRSWVLDTKQATFLSSSDNFSEIASFVKKVGTNPYVRDKSARFALPALSSFVAQRRHFLPHPPPLAEPFSALSRSEVAFCDPTGNRTRITSLKS